MVCSCCSSWPTSYLVWSSSQNLCHFIPPTPNNTTGHPSPLNTGKFPLAFPQHRPWCSVAAAPAGPPAPWFGAAPGTCAPCRPQTAAAVAAAQPTTSSPGTATGREFTIYLELTQAFHLYQGSQQACFSPHIKNVHSLPCGCGMGKRDTSGG